VLLRAGWVVPVDGPPVRDGAVAVGEGRILDVGAAARVAAAHPGLPERDLGEVVLTPGLVDAHCHLEWSLTADLLPPGGFAGWLGGFLKLRARMRAEDHRSAAALGALRALECGTTTVADSGPTGAGAGALAAVGLRGIVHLEAFGAEEGAAAREAAARHAAAVAALDEDAGPQVAIGVSPHAPYTVGPGLWGALAAHPDLGGRPWATHLAESPEETALLSTGNGPLAELFRRAGLGAASWPEGGGSPVARLAAAGALREGLVAAHCVQLGPGDAERLAAHGVGVAHCPQSNAYLRCGRAPLERLVDAGAAVGLGSDSPGSAGAYDVRAEARACGLVHGASGPGAPTSAALLRLATLGGARALGLGDLVGSLRPGKRADLAAFAPAPGAEPGDPAAAALDPRAEVRLVMVDGQVVLDDDGPTRVDRGEVLNRASGARSRLC